MAASGRGFRHYGDKGVLGNLHPVTGQFDVGFLTSGNTYGQIGIELECHFC